MFENMGYPCAFSAPSSAVMFSLRIAFFLYDAFQRDVASRSW